MPGRLLSRRRELHCPSEIHYSFGKKIEMLFSIQGVTVLW